MWLSPFVSVIIMNAATTSCWEEVCGWMGQQNIWFKHRIPLLDVGFFLNNHRFLFSPPAVALPFVIFYISYKTLLFNSKPNIQFFNYKAL